MLLIPTAFPLPISGRNLISLLIAVLAVIGGTSRHAEAASLTTSASQSFTKNMGQWPDSVLFRASTTEAVVWVMKDGIYFQYSRRIEREQNGARSSSHRRAHLDHEASQDSIVITMVKTVFVGANPYVELTGLDKIDYTCNYFYGNNPANWRSDVPNYSAVRMHRLYSGVDAMLTFSGDHLQLHLAGAADAKANVAITYMGAPAIDAGDGSVILQTQFGEKKFRYGLPLHEAVASTKPDASLVTTTNTLSLSYSTYLGGGSDDVGNDIGVDETGSAYVAGDSFSSNFPTVNPIDGSLSGTTDAYVTKVGQTGNTLVFSTYFGGSMRDLVRDIALDGAGNAYLTGHTNSPDFPTASAYDSSYNGLLDAFAAKLNAAGNTLVFSTYLGGALDDDGYGIAMDAGGFAYITGSTRSVDFPANNAFDASLSGATDGFVTKLKPAGNTLDYSTYLGGSGAGEQGEEIVVDGEGYAYVVGSTNSSDFPISNPFDSTLGGTDDAFVTKLNRSGTGLDYSTFLGGGSADFGLNIALDGSGSVYVTGNTSSSDFPTAAPFDASLGGPIDAFVTKLNPTGTNVIFSTYLGGSGADFGIDITLDGKGGAHVTGITGSTDFPIINPLDGSLGGIDAFVTKLNSAGNTLDYSTYLGGSSFDYGFGIAVDRAGSAYITGYTNTSDFPTVNPLDGTLGGLQDGFVSKFNPLVPPCCILITGNADCDLLDQVDIADVITLVDHLFINNLPLCCTGEANIDAGPNGQVDIADLTLLIDHLFVSNPSLPNCL